MPDIITKIITNKNELAQYCDNICDLFEECFSAPMSVELWKWAYLNNVYGNPIVAMSFAEGKLVGHYAVIPNDLVNKNAKYLKSALSMTTMVAESHRKHYLFTTLAKKTYAEMQKQRYDIVCGFPNKISAPGFRKRLSWKLEEQDYVALVTKEQLLCSRDLNLFLFSNNRYGFDIKNNQKLDWRISKPGSKYQVIGNNIVKQYGDNLDLMYLGEETIIGMDENKKYNVLIDASIRDLLEFKVFDYQFGYRQINNNSGTLMFDKSMLMSDVF